MIQNQKETKSLVRLASEWTSSVKLTSHLLEVSSWKKNFGLADILIFCSTFLYSNCSVEMKKKMLGYIILKVLFQVPKQPSLSLSKPAQPALLDVTWLSTTTINMPTTSPKPSTLQRRIISIATLKCNCMVLIFESSYFMQNTECYNSIRISFPRPCFGVLLSFSPYHQC